MGWVMQMSETNKPKLTIDEQIQNMKDKNIQFSIVNEKEAEKFLSYNNYYFKIKAYLKVFDKYSSGENKGKYYNVDFAYIKELSTLDMYFRKAILNIALDTEHYLKVKILFDISNNSYENGYDIVNNFISQYDNVKDRIALKSKNSTCEQLIKKNIDKFSAWNLIEVLSFGDFINFYSCYYNTYGYAEKDSMVNELKPIKFLRNAAAHNNCLLNTLRDNTYNGFQLNRSVNSFIAKIKICSSNVLHKKMGNRVIHDFVVLLYVFYQLTSKSELQKSRINTFNDLKIMFDERFAKHDEYFNCNALVTSNFDFLKKVVDKMVELSI